MPAIGIDEMSSATQRALTPGDLTTLCRTPGGALLRGLRGRPCIQVQAEEIVQCIAFQDNWCQVRCDAGVGWLQTHHLLHDYAEVEAQAARIRMLKEEIAERGGRIRMLEAQEARILLHPSAGLFVLSLVTHELGVGRDVYESAMRRLSFDTTLTIDS